MHQNVKDSSSTVFFHTLGLKLPCSLTAVIKGLMCMTVLCPAISGGHVRLGEGCGGV